MKRNEDILTDLWDNIKCTNIKEKEKQPEKIFEETIVENFPNMGKENDLNLGSSESHTG